MKVTAIVPAAGQGKRLGSRTPKAFIPVFGKPLLIHTLEALSRAYLFDEILVPVPKAYLERAQRVIQGFKKAPTRVIEGGQTRAQSVRRALDEAHPDTEWILVHDAARPLVESRHIQELLKEVKSHGAVVLVEPVSATVKEVDLKSGLVHKTLERSTLFLAQTPQVMKKDLLEKAYKKLGTEALGMTDEAAIVEAAGGKVKILTGDRHNIKITTQEDLELFKYYASRNRV